MTAEDKRAAAIAHLRQLRERLESGSAPPELARLVEECEHLIRAIESFHMEAIRFRMYGLTRGLSTSAAPPDAVALLDAAREALRAAGLRTR